MELRLLRIALVNLLTEAESLEQNLRTKDRVQTEHPPLSAEEITAVTKKVQELTQSLATFDEVLYNS